MKIDQTKEHEQVIDIVNKLRNNGFIPKDVNPQFSRGLTHYFLKEMWNDAANNSGRIIDLLHKAADQEIKKTQNDGLGAQVVRAALPDWAANAIVGPEPKQMTLTELAVKANNPEAGNFQNFIKTKKTESETQKQDATPSPRGSSQD